ncbi:DUF302 domain-containing protein [Mucilaginibacter sp. McL0603]|uniref:DUF302 domain-containing protein n=1 Tax=Mucilaginibacter sp. McL0603 TaxID=3415670 RepID=UPI003CF3DE40
MNPKGITIRSCECSVKEIMNRLVVFLQQNGATIYVRINQQMELNQAGLDLGPLEFLMFSNPKSNGAVMIENPVTALDLPSKIIAWEDQEKKRWIAYNDAAYLKERYSLPNDITSSLELHDLISKALDKTS